MLKARTTTNYSSLQPVVHFVSCPSYLIYHPSLFTRSTPTPTLQPRPTTPTPNKHNTTQQGDPDVPLPSPYAHGIMVVGNVQWPGLHKTLGRPVDPNYAYGALPPPFPIVDTPRDPALMAVPGNRLGPGQRHPTPGAFPSQNDTGDRRRRRMISWTVLLLGPARRRWRRLLLRGSWMRRRCTRTPHWILFLITNRCPYPNST